MSHPRRPRHTAARLAAQIFATLTDALVIEIAHGVLMGSRHLPEPEAVDLLDEMAERWEMSEREAAELVIDAT